MYQRGKVQGGSKVSQRINKLYPKLSPNDPNAIWERLSLQSDQRAAAAAEQAMQQRMIEEQANQQRLIQIEEDTNRARAARLESERPMNRARAALTSLSETPVGQIGSRVARTAFQRFPVVGYGAASASMGRNVAEVDEAMRNKEYIDAILAASQLAATGASMYPPLAPVAIPAALGLEAVKQVRDYYR
jgi:beta-phosphoglucomutase-like phosphatase (HAD superfamily)